MRGLNEVERRLSVSNTRKGSDLEIHGAADASPTIMSIDYNALALPKGQTRKQAKAKAAREHAKHVKAVRAYVFDRENGICRCCRIRLADSMHEIVPRSLGGEVSRENSVALCGSGTTGCHGRIQSHRIKVHGTNSDYSLVFEATSEASADWMAGR